MMSQKKTVLSGDYMNLLEAIQNCGDNWFRPIGMSKGNAFGVNDGLLVKHSIFGGSYNTLCIPVVWLTGEWEIVTPETVMAERIK